MRFLFVLLLFLPIQSWAQDFFNFLSSDSPSTSIELEGVYLPSSDIEGGPDKTQVMNQAVGVNQKIYQSDKSQVIVGAKYQKLDLTAESPLLNDYYNEQATLSYKRQLKDDNFWLGNVSFGSASDRPWKSNRDNTISANYIQKFNSRWFGVLNYSNNRPFLNNIPLPGFFYVKELNRERALMFGFPIIYWMNPLGHHWTIRYLGILPWGHRLKFLYTKWKWARPYVGFEQHPQIFFRSDREEQNKRFFWFERRLMAGIEGDLSRAFRFDISGGWAFDRQFFEATNFSQSKDFLLNVENAYFISLSFRYNF